MGHVVIKYEYLYVCVPSTDTIAFAEWGATKKIVLITDMIEVAVFTINNDVAKWQATIAISNLCLLHNSLLPWDNSR